MKASTGDTDRGVGHLLFRVVVLILVVVTGSLNNICKLVATKPLTSYTYMLSLATSVTHLPLYAVLFAYHRRKGDIPDYQLDFIWRKRVFLGFPAAACFLASSVGDTLGNVIGMICAPYVAGPIQSLLASATPIFIALLSLIFIGRRYSLFQCLALLGTISAVTVGAIPGFLSNDSATDPAFAAIQAGSCIFNAASFVIQEMVFARYTKWKIDEGYDDNRGLHVFALGMTGAIFGLPFTLMCVPMNEVMGQTHGQSIAEYLSNAFACVLHGECGPQAVGSEMCGRIVCLYILLNLSWNIAIVSSVKMNGALATFVALKGVFPLSTVLFAYVDWPLLGVTPVKSLTWLSMLLLLPCIFFFQNESMKQEMRYPGHSKYKKGDVLCLWPVCNKAEAPEAEQLLDAPEPEVMVGGRKRAKTWAGFTHMDQDCYACPYKNLPDYTQNNDVPCATSILTLRRLSHVA